jgi:predicted nucleotidyltransferase/HEPN domain-containing protein
MKSSTAHLPEKKQAKLTAMAAKIRAEAPAADLIVLFGSHARGDWVEDPETGYRSDYDLLVVVESPEVAEDSALWSRVESAIAPIASPSPVTVIVHDLRELNQQIRRGQFFFAELWEQGVVLFDARKFTLARPKAGTPTERREIAQEYFDHWFTSAGQFFALYQDGAARGWNAIAAFQLHQAAERYLASALLVILGTKPTTHDLEVLSKLIAPLHPLLAEPFPRGSDEDDRLFKLLKRAYIEARYKKSYRISAEELVVLGARVRDLAERVERACREVIAGFGD